MRLLPTADTNGFRACAGSRMNARPSISLRLDAAVLLSSPELSKSDVASARAKRREVVARCIALHRDGHVLLVEDFTDCADARRSLHDVKPSAMSARVVQGFVRNATRRAVARHSRGQVRSRPLSSATSRGFFSETYSRRALAEAGIDVEFVQDNHSLSRARGVVRGLHYQLDPFAQGKLVRVVRGAIFDVAVDIRQGSPTFGQYVVDHAVGGQLVRSFGCRSASRTASARSQPDTEVIYKVTAYLCPRMRPRRRLRRSRPRHRLARCRRRAVLSDKDRRHPRLRDLPAQFRFLA